MSANDRTTRESDKCETDAELELTPELLNCLERCQLSYQDVLAANNIMVGTGLRSHLAFAIHCALEKGVSQEEVARTVHRGLDSGMITAAANLSLFRRRSA